MYLKYSRPYDFTSDYLSNMTDLISSQYKGINVYIVNDSKQYLTSNTWLTRIQTYKLKI